MTLARRRLLASVSWTVAVTFMALGLVLDYESLRQAALFLCGMSVATSYNVIAQRERIRVETLIDLCRAREEEEHVGRVGMRSVR